MTNQFDLFVMAVGSGENRRRISDGKCHNLLPVPVITSNQNQTEYTTAQGLSGQAACIQAPSLPVPLIIEPTFLKLDLEDFVQTLEHEYYYNNNNTTYEQQLHNMFHSKTPSPTTPLFKCKWIKSLSTPSQQTNIDSIQQQTHVDENIVNSSLSPYSPNSYASPLNNTTKTTTSISCSGVRNEKGQEIINPKNKIQKKRNYQRVFHTIPARNSCSEKKTGGWKFHLMDGEDEEEQSAFKFHFYSGNNQK